MEEKKTFKYDAFISYRHCELDKFVAENLHKLLETYKANVLASYHPRSTGSYKHPDNTFINSIKVAIEDEPGIGRNRVKIVLDNEAYPTTMVYDKSSETLEPRTVTVKDVYEFLTEGTRGGGYYYFRGKDKKWHQSYNYSTPAHLFEQHTQWQMKGYLESLNPKDFAKNKRYKRRK